MSEFTGNPQSGFGGTHADGVIFWASSTLGGSDPDSPFGDVCPPWTASVTPFAAASHMGLLGGVANTIQTILWTASDTHLSAMGYMGLCFDTSAIPADATVDAVTLSIKCQAKNNNLSLTTGAAVVVTPFAPSDPGTFVAADLTNVGTSNLGSKAYADFTADVVAEITLNASAVTKGGITKLALMLADIFNGSFTGTHPMSDPTCSVSIYSAESSGNEPELAVTYTEASGVTRSLALRMLLNRRRG